jgi:hypothetical protein
VQSIIFKDFNFDNPQELFLDSNSQDLSIELNGCQFRKKFKIRSIEVEDRGYIKQQITQSKSFKLTIANIEFSILWQS